MVAQSCSDTPKLCVCVCVEDRERQRAWNHQRQDALYCWKSTAAHNGLHSSVRHVCGCMTAAA